VDWSAARCVGFGPGNMLNTARMWEAMKWGKEICDTTAPIWHGGTQTFSRAYIKIGPAEGCQRARKARPVGVTARRSRDAELFQQVAANADERIITSAFRCRGSSVSPVGTARGRHIDS